MNLKAFNKIYSEALDAIGECRFYDALALTEAIFKDTPFTAKDQYALDKARAAYDQVIHAFSQQGTAHVETSLSESVRQVIETLQEARRNWLLQHKATPFGRIASQLSDISPREVSDQILRTTRSKVGEPAYYEALDAAFGLSWCISFAPDDLLDIEAQLPKADSFVRRTVVGGLLMGIMDCFQPAKVQLLLTLGATAEADLRKASLIEDGEQKESMTNDATDLQARVAVALTLVCQRYKHFLPHYPELCRRIHDFFFSESMRPQLPMLMQAIVSQSLTQRVNDRVEDIIDIIKDVVEKQMPRLGSSSGSDDSQSPDGDTSGDGPIKVQVARIDIHAGNKLFKRMMNYARTVDAMRSNDIDVNYGNFINMKQFEFFDHPAHWIYPFSLDEPHAAEGLHLLNGKLDLMTLSIMDHSRFCSSDRYSYAAMMSYLRRDGKPSISDQVMDQLEQLHSDDDDDDDDDDEEMSFMDSDSDDLGLNPFNDFCQSLYRLFHSKLAENGYADLFASADDVLLSLLPPFEGAFTQFDDIQPSLQALMLMGDNEHAVILLNHFMEHHGSTAQALALRGHALMQQRQWRQAVSDFQQSLLIEEDDEVRMSMARCFEAQNEWERALPLLQQEDERQQGKDAALIEEIARCLVQLRRWDDAVQRFFQLEFMGEHLNVSQRGIGWCSLHQGKFERAEQYYRKLIDAAKKPSWEDLFNLGHALWLQGKTAEAVDIYHKFTTAFNRARKAQRQNFRHWSEAFQEDARNLLCQHFSKQEIALMQDAISRK